MPRFDPKRIQKYTSDGATEWMEHSGFSLADVVNEDEARLPRNSARWVLHARQRGLRASSSSNMMRFLW